MKKTLIALAAVAVTGMAMAQSSVTLGGVIGFGYQKNTAAAKGFTNTDATFRLTGSEDLGGGLKANFNIDYDTTGTTFASTPLRRNASIGLSGGFGTVSITNTRSGDLLTRAFVAPSYLPDGLYDVSGIVARSPVDVFTYVSPKFGAFTLTAQYVEVNSDGNTTPANKVYALTLGYADGPLNAGFAVKHTTDLPPGARKNNWEAFATYDFGVARVGFGLDGKMNANPWQAITAADAGKVGWALGVAAPFGPLTVGLNYAKRNDNKVTELAADYSLSKRTRLNFSAGKQNVDVSSQYRLAVIHSF